MSPYLHVSIRLVCGKCFLLLCSLGQRAETGSGEKPLEAITGTQGEASPQKPFVYWAFTTCKGPVQTPLYGLIHLMFTIPYKVGAMHGPTLLTSKLRLREVKGLARGRTASERPDQDSDPKVHAPESSLPLPKSKSKDSSTLREIWTSLPFSKTLQEPSQRTLMETIDD